MVVSRALIEALGTVGKVIKISSFFVHLRKELQ